MADSKLQATQTVLYDVLSEIANAQNEQLDSILNKINTSLMVPGLLSLVSGLVVNVGNTTITKPNGTKVCLVLGDLDVGGLGGSINFANGTGSGDVQNVSLPSLIAEKWYKAGFEIRDNKKIYVIFGAIGDSEALAGFPDWSEVGIALGYVSLQVNTDGDGWENLTNSSINQFGGGGSEGQADHTLLTGRFVANQHPTSSIDTDTDDFLGELSSVEDTSQKAFVRLEQFGSIFNWANGKDYRIGNVVKATWMDGGEYGTTIYRCIEAHTSSSTFDNTKFELVISEQDHNTLANKNEDSAHPTSSIDTDTNYFLGELSSIEDTSQKAFVRLEQFGSIFDWANGKDYRIGNVVKAIGEYGTTSYRCIEAHTSSATFDNTKFELVISEQDHNTLANKNADSAHPTSSIDTDTDDFSGELSSIEDTSQKAFVRLEQFGSIFNWADGKDYRIGNVIKQSGAIYRCIVAHTSETFVTDLTDGNWEILISNPVQEVQTVTNPSGQTVFTLSSITIPSGADDKLMVFINGIYQIKTTDYTIDSATQVTFTSTVIENAKVVFRLSY